MKVTVTEFERIKMACENNTNSNHGGLNVVDIKRMLKRLEIKHRSKCKRAELVSVLRNHVYKNHNLEIINTSENPLVKITTREYLDNISKKQVVNKVNNKKTETLKNGLNYIDHFIKEFPKLYEANKRIFEEYKSHFNFTSILE